MSPKKSMEDINRRDILRSVAVGGVASVATLGTMSAQAVAEETGLEELSGDRRQQTISEVQNDESFRQIESALKSAYSIRPEVESAVAYEVTEVSEEKRPVVSIPYTSNGENPDRTELFIQYTGMDKVSEKLSEEIGLPTFAGYYVNKSQVSNEGEISTDAERNKTEKYVIENGNVTSRTIESDEVTTNSGTVIPCCGGGGGCSTCVIETATGCAPSVSCILDIIAAFGTSLATCGACYASPEPISKSLACAGCVGAVVGNRNAPSCLGCSDTEFVCVSPGSESTVC